MCQAVTFFVNFVFRIFWGHFEAFFEHGTANDFQKIYSLYRLFAVDCFHCCKIQTLRPFQQNSIFGKILDFRLIWVIVR